MENRTKNNIKTIYEISPTFFLKQAERAGEKLNEALKLGLIVSANDNMLEDIIA
ncbi:MAG: hypothetical protein ACK5N8_06700 [Alphaproteobacteria bacterium]